MSGIICAVRGGPASQPTIEKAIDLAKETNLLLRFLYVVNLDFLSHTQISRTSMISDELNQMGEFILLTTQEKAKRQGIDTEAVIRHGNVREEIIELAKEIKADYVVLGLPVGEKEKNVFIMERIKEFGNLIEEASGAKIVLSGGDDL
jgi:nucleotide-binding universal stress UspA family protein